MLTVLGTIQQIASQLQQEGRFARAGSPQDEQFTLGCIVDLGDAGACGQGMWRTSKMVEHQLPRVGNSVWLLIEPESNESCPVKGMLQNPCNPEGTHLPQ